MSSFLDAFKSRRVGVMVPLGFGSGLPLLLCGSTLTAWMTVEGVDIKTVAAFSLVTLPYSVKFLWAPLLDRYTVPLLGRRRGWMILLQFLLMGAIAALGTVDPVSMPTKVGLAAAALAFLSASHDIVADAYRTDVLSAHERASGTAIFVAAYRVALIVAGAGSLVLAETLSWRVVYFCMAGLMSIGVIGTVLAPPPTRAPKPPANLRRAIMQPIREFASRREAWALLLIVMGYKIGDAVAGHLVTPFLLTEGFELAEIGVIQKGFGLAATIVGTLVAGGLVSKLGLKRSLILFGILQASANVFYMAISVVGPSRPLLIATIGIDNLFGGFGTMAFVAFLMWLCDRRYTATQYAIFSACSSLPGKLLGPLAGEVVSDHGWFVFFATTIVAAVPAVLLLMWVRISDEVPDPPEPLDDDER